ncbi:MAG: VPLPA-CTERM sorting domain-containing protein [Microgenomates group bacterium]
MFLNTILKTTLVCASFAVLAPSLASALTIDFNGTSSGTPLVMGAYQIDDARIVNGNCNVLDCLALNKNETSILTRVDGAAFTLTSIWFQLLGNPADLLITGSNIGSSVTLSSPPLIKNTPYNHLFDGTFANVTSVIFSNIGKGNIRIDDIVLGDNPTTVPLPAGAGLLIAALGSLGVMRRRRAAA